MIVIVHAKTPVDAKEMLKKMGHHVIDSMACKNLPSAIAEHPDMQIHPLKDNLAIVPPECYDYYRNILPDKIKLLAGKSELSGTYPEDSAYNVARINNIVLCNKKTVDSKLFQYYQRKGFSVIHTNQGYTKCNIAVFGNKFVLTEDVGIHNIIIANNLDVSATLVPKGEIQLDGFPYGFIGGSCGGYKNTLFWYGNPKECSYYETIEKLCEGSGINNIPLFEGNLFDMGGIICFPL